MRQGGRGAVTCGTWRFEAVSDACRVVVGFGRKKIIIARLAPKQLPESETTANALLMAASKDLFDALKSAVENCPCSLRERDSGHRTGCYAPGAIEAMLKAEGGPDAPHA